MKWLKFLVFFLLLPLAACSSHCTTCDKNRNSVPEYMKPEIMVLNVSTDGNYAVSSDLYQHIVLWNLKDKTYKIVAKNANVYSAYFIKNSDNFMYQSNKDNEVYVENVNDQIVKTFNPGFTTYGQAITSNLNFYIGIDDEDQIFTINNGIKTQLLWHYCGPAYKNEGSPPPAGKPSVCGSFMGDGKLSNITISPDEKYFVTSDSSEFYIWNIQSNTLQKYVQKNVEQTFATISPDGQFVLSSGYGLFLFSLPTGQFLTKINTYYNPATGQSFDTNNPFQTGDLAPNNNIGDPIVIKFIDQTHYLAIFDMDNDIMQGGFHYAGLFELGQDKALKYLDLLAPKQDFNQYNTDATWNLRNYYASTYPVTQSYVRDEAIDTSPSAHVLVIAQQNNNGILVYQYDPTTQTLKQVWAPAIPKPHWWEFWKN